MADGPWFSDAAFGYPVSSTTIPWSDSISSSELTYEVGRYNGTQGRLKGRGERSVGDSTNWF